MAENYDGITKIYDSFYRLGQVKVPTVAAVRGSAVGAGMNMLLAADLRIIAKDAQLICGFLKRGLHPGGGHFVILSRLVGREAAAAMALFGEEINGERAHELGLAWESVDDAAVEDRAMELARRVAADPELARAAVGNFRKEVVDGAMTWGVATQFERPPRCGPCAARPGDGPAGINTLCIDPRAILVPWVHCSRSVTCPRACVRHSRRAPRPRANR